MVNSASAALAEFKSQRMGGIMSGTSSQITGPTIQGLDTSATDRIARSQPKQSSSIFLDNIKRSGSNYHQQALANIQSKQRADQARLLGGQMAGTSLNTRYSLPNGGAGGNYTGQNGRLGPNGGGGDYGLTKDASYSLKQLSTSYAKQFGSGLSVNDGYRDIQGQIQAKQAEANGGPKAADVGTSVHGWGQAVDLGGAIQNSGSAQHAWLRQNAAQFKWYWVGKNFGEAWHWEYHPEY